MRRPADLLGAHVSNAGGLHLAPARAAALPARAFQIFTKNQNQWAGHPLTDEAVSLWQAAMTQHRLDPAHVSSHDSYLINLASRDAAIRARSIAAFTDEIERAGRLGIRLLVFHPGSHLGTGEAAGIAAVAEGLDECIERAGAGRWSGAAAGVLLCIEGTAGQGTNLGWRFEHLRDMIAASRYPDRVAVCLDTCHLFAAGHPLGTPEEWRATVAAFDATVGLGRLRVLHLNDSRREFGSRVDRHARIGEGWIGALAFRHILRERRLRGVLGILELSGGDDVYAEELAKLRALKARPRPDARPGPR